DYYWEKLSADPASEQCGWLKDKFGVTWQIVPRQLNEYLNGPDAAGAARATQTMLKMKKLDVAELKKAYDGK
ncbi:MAG TPA: VOC family protein, partial [Candidatus Saccharimonadia bacterium]|nr:VOC family protein [Candidatus Saccharimonadia bacterium]